MYIFLSQSITNCGTPVQNSAVMQTVMLGVILYVLTINVPVVFMARYVMILRGATSLLGALEGVGPENRDFFGPKKVEVH